MPFVCFVNCTGAIFIRNRYVSLIAITLSLPAGYNIIISHGVPSFYFYSILPEPGTPLETFYNWGTNYYVLGLTINPIYNLLVLSIATAIMLSIYTIYNIIPKNKGLNR